MLSLLVWAASLPGFAVAQTAPPEQFPVEPREPAAAAEPAPRDPAPAADAQINAIPETPVGVAQAMGWHFTAAFLFLSILAVWFSVERLVVLRTKRIIPRAFVERFLDHLSQGKLEPGEALRLCEENGSPVALIFAHGIRKWGKPSVEVEQAIIDGGERQVSHLRKHLRALNGISTISPLIGLLGTVVGMIQSFNAIAGTSASGKSEQLAIGIALALLTTAVGLFIAIPTMMLYLYFAGRIDALVSEMDALAQSVVHMISAEGLASAPVVPARPRARRPGEKERETA